MEEETLAIAIAISCGFLFFDERKQGEKLLEAGKEWMHRILKQKARRTHGQYYNHLRGLSLGNREYNFRSMGLTFLISLDSHRHLKIALVAAWVGNFLRHSDWFFVVFVICQCILHLACFKVHISHMHLNRNYIDNSKIMNSYNSTCRSTWALLVDIVWCTYQIKFVVVDESVI